MIFSLAVEASFFSFILFEMKTISAKVCKDVTQMFKEELGEKWPNFTVNKREYLGPFGKWNFARQTVP